MHWLISGSLGLAIVACATPQASTICAVDSPGLSASPNAQSRLEPTGTTAPDTPASEGPKTFRRFGELLLAETEHFRIFSNLKLDGPRLAKTCERTRSYLRAWMKAPKERVGGDVDLFLVRDAERIAEIERDLRVTYSRGSAFRATSTGGGYYHGHRVIILEVSEERRGNLEWFVSHEVCHSVLRVQTRSIPVVVNEGLSELIPQWVLHSSKQRSPESIEFPYPSYAATCRQLAREERVPPLDVFMKLTPKQFQSNREHHFPLAWSLLRTLMTTEEEGAAGELPTLLRAFGEGENRWMEFRSVYDTALVSRLWRKDLTEMAAQVR